MNVVHWFKANLFGYLNTLLPGTWQKLFVKLKAHQSLRMSTRLPKLPKIPDQSPWGRTKEKLSWRVLKNYES